MSKILESIYEGEIPEELSMFTYAELIKFVEDGFGKLDSDFKVSKFAEYEKNIVAFSGAKTFQEAKDLSNFVFNDKGEKRAFKEFKEFALGIDEQYNITWLKTEQDTAFGMSQSADAWIDIEEDADIFPYLQYQTADDERVRHSHKAWDNIIRPVDDNFWTNHMPLNGYRCRCRVKKLTEGKASSLRGIKKNDDPMFNINPGKVDYIFNEKKHPYFKHTKKEDAAFKKAVGWR